MRHVLWFLVLFAVAAAVAIFAGNNQGTVTLFWPPYRIDLSLNLVLLLLLAAFALLYAALRGMAVLLDLPEQARRWRLRHRERQLQQGLLDTLSHLGAGRFLRARKAAEQVAAQSAALQRTEPAAARSGRLTALAHLLAAEAAHALQDRAARDEHARAAEAALQPARRDEQEVREGLLLRMTRWAFDDRDLPAAQQRLQELPQGLARRTLALRLRLKVARQAGQHLQALETARLLAKHRAFSPTAASTLLRGLAQELVRHTHDAAQLRRAWNQLDAAERQMPEVVLLAGERLLGLDGDFATVQQWLLPLWDPFTGKGEALAPELRTRLVLLLEQGFRQSPGQPDGPWLARIEAAQLANPRDPLLQYLAGVACMHLQLWGKAQQLLRQAVGQLDAAALRRRAWRALAQLAEQRGEADEALRCWRAAAQD